MDTISSSVASAFDRGTIASMSFGAFAFFVVLVLSFYALVGKQRKGMPTGPAPLPIVGNLLSLGQHPHEAMAQLAKQYGSVMRFFCGSVQVVVLSDARAAKELFTVSDASFASRPVHNLMYTSAKYMNYGAEDVSMGLSVYSPRVRELRQVVISELFTVQKLETRRSVRREEIHRTVAVFTALAGRSVAFRPVVSEFGCRNSCRNLFNKAFVHSEEFGLHPAAFRKFEQELFKILATNNLADIIPAFRLFDKLDLQGLHARWRNVSALVSSWTASVLEWYRKNAQSDDSDKDFAETLLSHAKEDGEKYSDIVIKSLIAELMAAGSETVASMTEWTTLELVRHPHILKRLQEEVDAQFGMLRAVEEDEAAQLPYLQAVVKEALRLHAPAVLAVPHCNVKEATLAGFQLPAGTPVIANLWAIHRDAKAWGDDALVFNPDRFLGSDVTVDGTHFHFIPFGAGRRICPGRGLAMRSLSTIVGSFVHAFEFSALTTLDVKESKDGLNLRPETPLLLQIVPRPSALLYSVSIAS